MIIDLTQNYAGNTPGFASEVAKTIQQDGWNASTLHIYSHAGTHMDAPIHFGVGSIAIDELAPNRFFGKAWVVEVAITQDHQLLTESVLEKIAEKIEEGDSILIKTGWFKFHHEARYRNALPRISDSFAIWMVNKRINRLVVEPPSVADVNNLEEVTRIHQLLLQGDIIIVEGICNTDQLSAKQVELITLPLKIKDGDGAPARVIAIQKK